MRFCYSFLNDQQENKAMINSEIMLIKQNKYTYIFTIFKRKVKKKQNRFLY